MIGLCSKTYVVSKTVSSKTNSAVVTAAKLLRMARKTTGKRPSRRLLSTRECKFSSKGVSKRLVKDPLKIFKGVLRTGKAAAGRNKGFRVRNNGIYTYEQTRCGFSYFYCKRRVLDDGIHTVPLDLVMCPVRKKLRIECRRKLSSTRRDVDHRGGRRGGSRPSSRRRRSRRPDVDPNSRVDDRRLITNSLGT